ncbi:O-antigen ligase family protein [candidate division KSB1 bacterium]|nr:O-antigen ligase family protein [candidate division KSB1 bacterium]
MLISTKLAFVVICVVSMGFGLLFYANLSRFLLAAAVMTIAWQSGIRMDYFNMDFTLTYLIFIVLFVWNFVDPQRRLQLKDRFPVLLYFWIGVIVFCALSLIPALNESFAFSGVARGIIDMMIFYAALKSLHSAKDVQYFVGALMAAMIFQGMLCMLQFKIPEFKLGVIDEVQSWMWWRSKGTFYHANEIGMYLVFMLPITARVLFTSLMQGNLRWAYFSGTALLVGGIALFTSSSRGAWIGTAFGILCMLGYDLFRRGLKLKKVLLGLSMPLVILAVIFAMKYGAVFTDRLFSYKAESMWEGRKKLQAESLDIIKSNPIIGVGYWNYHLQPTTYFVHNVYLLIAAEIGIPGLVFMAGFLLAILAQAIKGMRSRIFFVSNLSRGCFASLAGFLIASIPGPDFWISHPVQMYFWMIVVLQVALLRLERQAMAQLKMHKQRSRNEVVSQIPGANEFSVEPGFERNTIIGNSFSGINKRQT